MLKIINIVKEYVLGKEESVLALNDVSIEFRKNEFVSILGPSGCGKTTLLNIIGGLDRYTSGDIQIDDISTKEYDDVDWDTYRNRRIGFVFQSYNLIPHLTILQNVSLGLTLAGVSREEANARALESLAKVGLDKQAKKRPNQLSGGQAQRVAIARALVNNPEIILADEPTGALDSESGLQVMDLLKEVAADRLVIMVTHNPMLAEEYSTRIVYLKDGKVEGDTMPYSSADEVEEAKDASVEAEEESVSAEVADEIVEELAEADVANEVAQEVAPEAEKQTFCERHKLFQKKQKEQQEKNRLKWLKRRHSDRSSMKLGTAISLSWNNLLSKKGRTLLTSIAGSIGIIGIILVLALSNGATKYVQSLEESTLSQYPLTISSSNTDLTSIMTKFLGTGMDGDSGRKEYPDTKEIYTGEFLGQLMSNFLPDLLKTNDLKVLKKYIENNFDHSLATVKYDYGVNFNAYIQDPKQNDVYMKVNPYTETMDAVLNSISGNFGDSELIDKIKELLPMAGSLMTAWTEMPDNQELLENQYELVDGEWPDSATELVVVVDKKNQLQDYQLFMLGLVSESDIGEAFTPSENGQYGFVDKHSYTTQDLLNLEYKIMTNADYLVKDGGSVNVGGKDYDTYTAYDHATKEKDFIDENSSLTTKVVGVVRPRQGATVTAIGGVLGYTGELTELVYSLAGNNKAIVDQIEIYNSTLGNDDTTNTDDAGIYTSIINYKDTTRQYDFGNNKESEQNQLTVQAGYTVDYVSKISGVTKHDMLMRALGVVVDFDNPVKIHFYCNSFEAKDAINSFLDEFNQAEDQAVSASSMLDTIMGFVKTMAETLTGVLVGFAAISLVVSTIMIAIIIYTSVLERRKEIGVLRSIGARKKDVARVFIAESAILGGYSGIIGVVMSYIISLIGSAILKSVFKITGLMDVTWWHCLAMFALSVVLSMFAGFIPSRIASKKDPAIALRSE